MKKANLIKVMMLAGILLLSGFMNDDLTNPTQEKVIELTNDGDDIANTETLQVPVTATLTPSVLNVQFNGNVPHAIVSVQNTLTGTTVSHQSMTALSGTVCTVPLTNMPTGIYTVSVTNNQSGESVSGEFEKETEE